MKKIKRIARIFLFVCLLLLASAGFGLPIPMYYKDRFAEKEFLQEQVDEKEETEE